MASQWSSFTERITVNATTRSIYDAWTSRSGLEGWFLASARFFAPDGAERASDERFRTGDTYHWTWHGYPDAIFETGTVLEANGHNRLQFTFTDDSVVTVVISSEGGGRIVELTQEKIKPDEKLRIYLDCSRGWLFYLVNLKSMLEGGIDLRNKNKNIPNVVNA